MGERERLKLWTIAPCDMGEKGMDWWRKQRKQARMHRLRQLRGQQSRAAYLASHNTSKKQPWQALGISRASWYRLRETSPCQVKLTKAEHQPVSPHNRQVSKESAEKELSVSTIQSTLQSEKPEMLVTDTARELLAPTCLTKLLAPTCANGLSPDGVKPWVTLALAGLPVSDYWAWVWLSSSDSRLPLAA